MTSPRTSTSDLSGDAPREGARSSSPRLSAASAVKLPFGRDLLIDAARQRARGISWEIIAEKTSHSAGELCRFAVRHPEAWRPLYVRAEKLRLEEAEGRTLAHLTALLKGKDEQAAESAARELLVHRRHVERRRSRRLPERGLVPPTGGELLDETTPGGRNLTICQGGQKTSFSGDAQNCERWFAEEPPRELEIALLAAARGVALGEAPASIAQETGRAAEEIARWAFVYAKTWDRAWRPARLEAAEFGAALAINRLLDFAAGPDAALAARAGRTLLIHRRHMHWANQPPRHQDLPAVAGTKNLEDLNAAETAREACAPSRDPSSNLVPLCLGGEKKGPPWRLGGERGWRSRDGP